MWIEHHSAFEGEKLLRELSSSSKCSSCKISEVLFLIKKIFCITFQALNITRIKMYSLDLTNIFLWKHNQEIRFYSLHL